MANTVKKDIDVRKFMNMAIDQMRKSIDEARKDGKASPKVGAVLISPDGKVLGTAFRGELREGDHAEYTLLDRKLRDKDVTGSILFATLEPCAHGARKPPKIECAQRIVNARIKKVYVGIEDPDPTVARKGLRFLEESGVEVEMFDKDLQDIIETENKQFLKEANTRAEEAKKPKVIELSPLERKVDLATIDELSNEALEYYIKRANLDMKTNSSEFLASLEQRELIKREVVPTGLEFTQDDSFRRNDVKPLLKQSGGAVGPGGIRDKFRNDGDRANILSFREFDDNLSYINMNTGWLEKSQELLIETRPKYQVETNHQLGYHIEVFFTDKDGRNYRQEFSRSGTSGTKMSEPEFIPSTQTGYRPTGLGILLFGKNPRSRYPQAVLKAEARYGDSEPEIQDFGDALVLVPEKIESWLRKVLGSRISREQFARITEYDYPIEVLREAVINALVHRDYDIESAKCFIYIDDKKIVVKSPGYPVQPIKFSDFKALRAPSLSRNPKLTAVFNAMEYVEERGIGMREMKLLPEKYHLPMPEIAWEDPFISITFPRSQGYFQSDIDPHLLNQLNEEEKEGLFYLRDNKEATKAQYAARFGYNDKKAQRQLTKMKELGLATQFGKGKAIKYVFTGVAGRES